MARLKKLAPAELLSMTETDLAAYNKAMTKRMVINYLISMAGVVAAVAVIEQAGKAVDKKLKEHYTSRSN